MSRTIIPGIPNFYHPLIGIFRFLLVSLNIDAILEEPTIYRRQERLSRMTNGLGLGDAYGTTIERIKAQGGGKSRLGMEALMWISHSERPLKANELCHALAVELGSTDFKSGNVSSISTLVSCCQGLITVDKEVSIVRLVHFTLQEYLSANPDIFTTPHSSIAEICLTYLNSEQVKAIPSNCYPDLSDTPFLKYCSLYWGVHAKRQLSDRARSLALERLQGYDSHVSTRLLSRELKGLYLWNPVADYRFSGLHLASFFGISKLVAALIEMECCDTNGGDFWGCSPLFWAAGNGHEEVVEILLGRQEVNPDKASNSGKTPLSHAARNGHEGVAKILLGLEDVDPNKTNKDSMTPLLFAAMHGHEGVVEILLEREEVNPDKPDRWDKTPLSYAAENGHEGVVKILLGREEVNPDKPDTWDQTPLSYAAQGGHEGVAKILLGRQEVNPDKPASWGQTPLSCAAYSGHEGVVKILLGREEVNPDKPDSGGQTPLSYAAQYGHVGVVKILLGRQEVNPDKADNGGKTPLMYAAESGHESVIEELKPHEVVTPERSEA